MLRRSVFFGGFLGLAALMFVSGCDQSGVQSGSDATTSASVCRTASYENITVTRVVDGDTLKLENGERVRLIGIDTPEVYESVKLYRDAQRSGQDIKTIQALGKRSSQFTRDLVQGKQVRLEFDVEKKDKYGRLLAYVYLPDGTFVNAEIIKQGYASMLTYPPNVKHVELFEKLYKEARDNNRGLWSK